MALKLTKKAGIATMTKQMKDHGQVISDETQEEKVDTPANNAPSQDPWCEVGVDMSYTHNLGNYQSAKVGVSLRLPAQVAEIDQVFDYAKEWVDTKLQGMIEELQSE